MPTNIADLTAAFPELSNIAPANVARSGQKIVFTATDRHNREVMLKLVKPEKVDDRFEREVKAANQLRMDCVPTIYDFGHRTVASKERFYIIEQRISGGSLRDVLNEGPLDIETVDALGTVLLEAVNSLATARLVHRDIKPENILRDRNGKWWLIDFGLVRFLDLESLTATGERFGPFTPGYAPREQMRNVKAEIDERSDLFAIGVTLHECLNGTPFHRIGASNVLDIIDSCEKRSLPRPSCPSTHEDLAELIVCMGSPYRSRRPNTAAEALQWWKSAQRP